MCRWADYNNNNYYEPATTPRSDDYEDRTIKSEGNVERNEIKYYQRLFTDGCAELARYDIKTKRWMILCFPNEDMTAKHPNLRI